MNGSIDGIMPIIGESSINAKQHNNNSNSAQCTYAKPTTSLWDAAPHSPTYSTNTQYHSTSSHSNSKESLWASTLSSPNSAHREQLQHPKHSSLSSASSTTSSSSPSSLWENPSSKMSQASLMSKNDSLSSIWQTPPQTQSPVNNNNKIISNIWDSPTAMATSPMSNNSAGSIGSTGLNMVRSQDFVTSDIWGTNVTNNTNALVVKAKDPVGSLWAHPTPPVSANTFNKMNSMITSTPSRSQSINHPIKSERNLNNNLPQINSTVKQATQMPTNQSAALASSSCMQLFSDEFINYLNMIN